MVKHGEVTEGLFAAQYKVLDFVEAGTGRTVYSAKVTIDGEEQWVGDGAIRAKFSSHEEAINAAVDYIRPRLGRHG